MSNVTTKLPQVPLDVLADHLIVRILDADKPLTLIKLQLMLYFVHAWGLALYKQPITDIKFQAWIHGPQSVALMARFKDRLYCEVVTKADVNGPLLPLDSHVSDTLEQVLTAYLPFDSSALQHLAQQSKPWRKARGSKDPTERCDTELSNTDMLNYFTWLMAEPE